MVRNNKDTIRSDEKNQQQMGQDTKIWLRNRMRKGVGGMASRVRFSSAQVIYIIEIGAKHQEEEIEGQKKAGRMAVCEQTGV